MKYGVLLLVVAACNTVFGVEKTELQADAPPPPDQDMDGVPDRDDNCPELATEDRTDSDGDGIGDRCDNCPLVRNTDQAHSADNDLVGDACDAHPTIAGDCLVLFDSFADDAHFADHWDVLLKGPAAAIVASSGSVTVTPVSSPSTTDSVALVARDDQGALLQGQFDTQLRAKFTLVSLYATLQATSNVPDGDQGYGCGVTRYSNIGVDARSIGPGGVGGSSAIPLSNEPAGTETMLRLSVPDPGNPAVRCRVEHGLAAGANDFNPSPSGTPIGGAPGFFLKRDPAEVDAIAFYRAQSAPCAPTIYR